MTKECDLLITVNNFELSYDDVGTGGIPVIFLHGFPFSKSMWKSQSDFLRSSYRLIACDIRGFGKSKDEVSSLNIDLFADDLVTFMDSLQIEKAIVCGLSMGGFIALNAIKKYPKRFEALILCDTQCVADTSEILEKRNKIIDEIEVKGVKDFNEGFIKSVFHKDTLENNMELVALLRSVVFANSQHIISQGLMALAGRSETCSILSEIKVPTLIICGREDEVTPLSQSEYMHKNIKGSILQVIDHAGHVSNLEKPDIFNEHLGNFLASLSTNTNGNVCGS